MRKIWVRKARSFREAERFDREYYQAMSPGERVETVQFIREQLVKIRGSSRRHAGHRTGLRRVLTIVQ